MNLRRRDFLRLGAMAGAGCLLFPRNYVFGQNSPKLRPFVDPLPIPPVLPGAASFDIHMRQFFQKLHRDLPPTKLWGYEGMFLGPTFEVRSGSPITVQWLNDLPGQKHFLPAVDSTIHGSESNVPEVRSVVHLHGAKVLADSDGYPEAWFTNGFGKTGPFFSTRVYHYPNDQAATMLWYHDHSLGITRLNVFAGLAGVYLIRDEDEDELPLPKGKFEIPLVFMDRAFNADGSLHYPVQTVPPPPPPVSPIWVPEFFGDTALVNGKILPFLEVEPRKYRFRMLNACNARFLHLTLTNSTDNTDQLHFHQIGTDQGFLHKPVTLMDLLMSPAERFDVVIDFTGQKGKSFILNNDAPAPFPGGGAPGMVPQFMEVRVTLPLTSTDQPLPERLAPVHLLETEDAVRVRRLTLRENDDPNGNPIIDFLGDRRWNEPITENPRAGTIEQWDLINTTTDGHPIHVHLVRFNVINRQLFDLNVFNQTGKLKFLGPPEPPAPNERPAWKDTVVVFPGDTTSGQGKLTRIIAKFDLPNEAEFPPGNRQQYVWHCHILEHEDNEMMRPYAVVSGKEDKD